MSNKEPFKSQKSNFCLFFKTFPRCVQIQIFAPNFPNQRISFRNKANWINKTSRRGIESPVVMLKRIKMCFAEFFKTEIYSRSGNEKSRIKTGISSNSKSKSKPPLIKNLSPKQWIFFDILHFKRRVWRFAGMARETWFFVVAVEKWKILWKYFFCAKKIKKSQKQLRWMK